MVEKTAEIEKENFLRKTKVKFDKEEDIKPLLIAFRKIFEPMVKSIKSIAKIPEEIERITKKISKDIESGVPERTANAVEKIADNPELVGPPTPEENEKKVLETLNAQLQLLLEQGIPAKIDEDLLKVVKLTEKEIKEKQKEFIQLEKNEKTIKEQIETVKKSDMTAEEMADKLQVLTENLQKNTQETQELETTLGNKTPQPKSEEQGGFQTPSIISEGFEAGRETFMAPVNVITELKDTFKNNIGLPLLSLILQGKKHHKESMEYAETGEKADKISILKFVAIAAAIAFILDGLKKWVFGDEDEFKQQQTVVPGGKGIPNLETMDEAIERIKKNNPNMSYSEIGKQVREANDKTPRIHTARQEGIDNLRDSMSKFGIDMIKRRSLGDIDITTDPAGIGPDRKDYSRGLLFNQTNNQFNNGGGEGSTRVVSASEKKTDAID